MRKHFLILMLMALLPLAGWAEGVDISGYTVKLSATSATYDGTFLTPDVTLEKSGAEPITSGFTVTWSPSEPKDWVSGGYTVTVTANDADTYNTMTKNTAKFMVLKKKIEIQNKTEIRLATGLHYDNGQEQNLLTVAPTVNDDATILYSIDNKQTWSSSAPKATAVGEYTIWMKTAKNNTNYFDLEPTMLEDGSSAATTVTIAGNDIVGGYTAPAATTETLTFTWDNSTNKAKALNLLKANTGVWSSEVKGTFKYAVLPDNGSVPGDATVWTDTPTASAAGNYKVFWKIEGATGYNPLIDNSTQYFTKTIGQGATVITAATAKANLVYKTDGTPAQQLIQNAATATNGASSLIEYQVKYKASSDIAWDDATPGNVTTPIVSTTNVAEVVGTNAGIYQIKAFITYNATGNYAAGVDEKYTEVAIAKANALTSAPTAADLTWNNAAQDLIVAGAGSTAEAGIIKYIKMDDTTTPAVDAAGWTATIGEIEGTLAGNYNVWYQVAPANTNYVTIAPTLIQNVMIKRKDLSIKIKDVVKTYNAGNNYDGAKIEGTETSVADGNTANEARFEFSGRIAGDGLEFTTANFPFVDSGKKDAGEYAGAVNINEENLANDGFKNYRYTIIPGKLTIKKAKLRVSAKAKTVTFGEPYDISGEWTITDLQGTDKATTAPNVGIFQTMPVLTTNAAATNPAPGEYEYTFTKGVLKTTAPGSNYEMDTEWADSENHDGYKIGAAKFTVNEDPEAKILVTINPRTVKYTGAAESWDLEYGVDYYVTGLISGDALTKLPSFRRSDPTNYNVGEYKIEAYGAEVADIAKYPGGIKYQEGTFIIEPAPLTAIINQQTVPVNPLPDAFDADAWDVTGLQGADATTGKSVLNGVLSYNTTTGANKANLAAQNKYTAGIQLTIANPNYVLAGANVTAGVAYGTLIVTSANVLALQSTDDNLMGKLQAAETHNTNYYVCFEGDDRKMLAKEWYAVVLPFETTPLELSTKLNTYVVVNLLKSSKIEFNSTNNRDEAVVNFGIEMDKIPAGTPFLIKPAQDVLWSVIDFDHKIADKKIKSTVVPTVTEKATFSATYETGKSLKWGYELDGTTENADMKYRWLANTTDLRSDNSAYGNAWYNCKTNAHALELMEAFLILDPAAEGARIFVEDIDDNGTTAIKSLNADQVNGLKVAEGWYTINGVKLQGMPTEKGIYINNGKKVVVK